jgi:FAD/FMN-containing dehydrogenase
VTGPYYEIFTLSSVAPYNESEWFVPVEKAAEAFQLFRRVVTVANCPLNMISELRTVKADTNWLSPMYQRDAAAINLLIKDDGAEFNRCLRLVDEAFAQYQARPHWGKLHSKTAVDFKALYPRWDDFVKLRHELDPNGVFLNDYLASLFKPN